MKWPNDGARCAPGEGIYARIQALPRRERRERALMRLPWVTRLRVVLGIKQRRRGVRVS